MTLQEVMTQARIDRTVIGIRRRTWSTSHTVIPSRNLERDVMKIEVSGDEKPVYDEYTPNLFDICATDWEPVR